MIRSITISAVLALLTPLVNVAYAAKPTTPAAGDKAPTTRPAHLGELNGLTKVLAPRGLIENKELERLLENAEAVALRDVNGRPSAQAITYAATLERQVETMKGERPLRILVDLGLCLATLANPAEELRQRSYADAFYKRLLTDLKVPESEARPRAEIVDELAQIGSWAQGMVEHFAVQLPASVQRLAMGRLFITTGRYAAGIDYLKPLANGDARLRALLGVARLYAGKTKEAESDLSFAIGHGGEAADIARAALREAARRRGTADLKRAFNDRDLGEDDGVAMCRQTQQGSAEQAAACAARLWMAGDLQAALQQSERAGNAPQWKLLKTLWQLGTEKSEVTRDLLRERVAEQVVPLPIGDRSRALVRLGITLQAALQTGGVLFTKSEIALLEKLHQEAPCDPSTLPLRLLAMRGDRIALGKYAAVIVTSCSTRADGLAATTDALQALLEVSHTPGPVIEHVDLEAIERVIMQLTEKQEDAALLALKGDALVLRGLRKEKAQPTAFRAALAIYEDALGRMSPLASPAQRSRLESNAAYVATSLIPESPKTAHVDLERRALKHLRLALSFGERPLGAAVRAKFGSLTRMLSTGTSPERWPRGPERQRGLCLLLEQAKLASDEKNVTRYQRLLSDEPTPPATFTVPELFIESGGQVRLLVEERGITPQVEVQSGLWFAPRCAEK